MIEYCLGLAIDKNSGNLLCIKKLKPEWQAGKYNGIGGKIENGETPIQGMVREFEEECGIKTEEFQWESLIKLIAEDYIVHIFYSDQIDINEHISVTKEQVAIATAVEVLLPEYCVPFIPNIRWLYNVCLDQDFRKYDLELVYRNK